ncbi:MAG: acyltransferase [Gemmatimonadaceae bacterium]
MPQTIGNKSYYSKNNFDLIRLIAALQVVLVHAIDDLHIQSFARFESIIEYFPGVPAFFFISGFLIKAAWERNPNVRLFYGNRAYRILPALWASVIVAIITLVLFFDRGVLAANAKQFALWVVGQATIGQVWTPGFLRAYGIGAVNGSLWTIPVELSFYAVLPLMAWLFARRVNPNWFLPIVIVASFAINYAVALWTPANPRMIFGQQLLMASPIPWIGMFCMGMLVQTNIDKLYAFFAGRAWIFLVVFVVVSILSATFPVYPLLSGPTAVVGGGNRIGVANYLSICALVLSAAYSFRGASDRLLRRNDLSYGLYISHALVINVVVQEGILGMNGFSIVMPVVVALAVVSWVFLEKPMLGRRKASLYRH